MGEILSYRINHEIKMEYDKFIKEKYGSKLGIAGINAEKAFKLFLTVNGGSDYSDDPDVKAMIQSIRRGSPCTHTHTHEDNDDNDINSNFDDEEYLDAKFLQAVDTRFDEFEKKVEEKIDEKLDIIEHNLQKKYSYNGNPSSNTTPMELYLTAFLTKYGEWTQVSYNELSSLAVQIHGVSDKRSIQNRINYLIGKGVITEFSPNVYNVKP